MYVYVYVHTYIGYLGSKNDISRIYLKRIHDTLGYSLIYYFKIFTLHLHYFYL